MNWQATLKREAMANHIFHSMDTNLDFFLRFTSPVRRAPPVAQASRSGR